MNMYFIEISDQGMILRYGFCAESSVEHQESVYGGQIIGLGQKVVNPDHYYSEGELLTRPQITLPTKLVITADGVDSIAFDLPSGTVVRIGDHEATTDDGLTFTTDIPGEYEIHIVPPFPFKFEIVTVVANEV